MKPRRSEQQRTGGRSERTRRQFTQEFKLEAVRLAAQGDRPASAVARELRRLALFAAVVPALFIARMTRRRKSY